MDLKYGRYYFIPCVIMISVVIFHVRSENANKDTNKNYPVQDRATLNLPQGEDFELRCQNVTDNPFAALHWYSTAYTNNETLTKYVYIYTNSKSTTISPYFKNRIERINGTSIRIKKAKKEDSGVWKCDILYQKKDKLTVSSRASYVVHIVSPPYKVLIQPNFITSTLDEKTEGKFVRTIDCETDSTSSFEISWHRKGKNFTENAVVNYNPTELREKGVISKRTVLAFKRLSEEDAGEYYCVAKNVGGTENGTLIVRIARKPVIFDTIKEESIDVNNTKVITCRAKGYPEISFFWEALDQYTLYPLDKLDLMNVSATTYSSLKEEGSSTLTLNVINKSAFGSYKCIAKNKAGNVVQDIKITGRAPPDPPTILGKLVSAEEDRIVLYWSLSNDNGAPIQSITIAHKNSSLKNGWTRFSINKPIKKHTISNLATGTWYDFRILAANIIGPSKFSKTFKVKTKEAKVVIKLDSQSNSSEDILGNLDLTALIGIFGGAFIALLVGCICMCIFVRKMQKGDTVGETQPHSTGTASYAPNMNNTLTRNNGMMVVDGGGGVMELKPLMSQNFTDEWEFPRDRLTITTVLGSGAFGVVMRGLAQGIKGSVGQMTVAVKTVRDVHNDVATKDLVAELNLLKLLPEHPNVVGLLGCCTRAEPIYVIVEYCSNGDLQGFLRSSRGIYERYYKTSYGGAIPNLTSKMLLTFAWQVSKGMDHLSSMKVIHRDLAARNILVNDQLVCKVSDFGFARDIYVEDHYLKRSEGGRFPIKWMSIESLLDGISTTKSDVWSYGVVLWELVTLGASPYPGMNSYEVVSFLQDGYRMDKPKHCSNEIYQLMMDCWNVAPGRRPAFGTLSERCMELMELSDDNELINMNFYPDHLYVNFDGASSQSASTATTPHGTLNRNHLVNMHDNPGTPKYNLRSPSGHTIRNVGRTSSVTALSERSVTGASTSSYNTERIGLITGNGRDPDRVGLLRGTSNGPS